MTDYNKCNSIQMTERDHFREILSKYLPENSVESIIDLIFKHNISLIINRDRITKSGDYHPPSGKHGHRISVNHNLNKYSFLLTLVHEIAHMVNWEKFQNRVKPHGIEWKLEYKALMKDFLYGNIFPKDVNEVVCNYMINPKAASCSDLQLMRVLKRYDKDKKTINLEELPQNSKFKINNGRVFCKGERIRKRYKCKDFITKRIYLFNPLAEVLQVTD